MRGDLHKFQRVTHCQAAWEGQVDIDEFLDPAGMSGKHQDPLAEKGRFRNGMGDEDDCRPRFLPDAQQFVLQEMNKPVDIAGLAAEATTPQLVVQVYAASLLAVEVDTPAEQQYFASLGQALRLPPAVIGQINHAMGLPA